MLFDGIVMCIYYIFLLHTMHGAYGSAEFQWCVECLGRDGRVQGAKSLVLTDTSQGRPQRKQDAAHGPECSHVKHFCKTSYII